MTRAANNLTRKGMSRRGAPLGNKNAVGNAEIVPERKFHPAPTDDKTVGRFGLHRAAPGHARPPFGATPREQGIPRRHNSD